MSNVTKALIATLEYVDVQLQPVRDELENILIVSGKKTLAAIILVILFVAILFIIWLCYEFSVSIEVMLALIVIIVLLTVVFYIIAVSAIEASAKTVVGNVLKKLIGIDSSSLEGTSLDILNSAARSYLAVIGINC